ncbi:cysteine desulfurase NifS [Rhizobium sp. KAs_5_22]|uniref:cysteine desulfurase NifS n=1 Tax=Ciceribacter selenitireducens TaxID=448181 RepID=UPI00048FDC33|nr:cysteine desulfurase NifS [Ciceribacter selenitireducens]PPJ49294.1 cysteine desulfurase NifS [Rhizobium sp. KAs_5_22]
MWPVYLDNNATTRTDPAVVEAMLPYFSECFGNPSSAHGIGTDVAKGIRTAREQVRSLVGAAHDNEIVFTSGGTESDNTAILSALQAVPHRDEVVVSAVEHPAILTLCRRLETSRGTRIHRIPVDGCGRLDIDAYRAALSEHTAIVSVLWANNETGAVLPVAELALMAKAAGALFHTDAVQAAGRLPIDLRTTAIDMLSLSAHKLHGPKGVGALYVRNGTPFVSLIEGGRQERARRAGTENVPGIIGLGKAAQLAMDALASETPRIAALRDRLEQCLQRSIAGTRINGPPMARIANTCNIAFEDVESDALLTLLGREGIACSSGSACASGTMEPSHVLIAMQVPPRFLYGALRFSLSRDTGDAEIDRVLAVMPRIVERLRQPASRPSHHQTSDSVHA